MAIGLESIGGRPQPLPPLSRSAVPADQKAELLVDSRFSFLSLQYEIPLGLYDADKLEGDVEIAVGTSADRYEGLNNRVNTLTGILVSKDAEGAFGSPYVDSKRTAVTQQTKNALHIFYLRPSMDRDTALQLLTAASNMFTAINGGDAEFYVV